MVRSRSAGSARRLVTWGGGRVGARTPERESSREGHPPKSRAGQLADVFASRARATARRIASPCARRGGGRGAAQPPPSPEREAVARLQEQRRDQLLESDLVAVRSLAREVVTSRIVYMRFQIYSLHNISAVDTSFFVDFKLEMRLVDLTTVHKRSKKHKVFLNDENLASIPFITIANAIDADVCEQAIITLDPSDPVGIVRWEQRFRGTVRLIQELHNFPFDHQHLQIDLRTEWYYRRLRPMSGSRCLQDVALAEWTLHRPQPLYTYENEAGRACAKITVQVTRRPRFYVWNVLLINFLICSLSLMAFAYPVDDMADRVSIVLSLLLTVMAFKFTVADLVPRVAYFTFLDLYLFLGIFLLVLVAAENAVVKVLSETRPILAASIDDAMLLIIAGAWMLLQLVLVALVHIYYARVQPHLEPRLVLPDETPIGGVMILPRAELRKVWRRLFSARAPPPMSQTNAFRWRKAIRYAVHVARQERYENQGSGTRWEPEHTATAARLSLGPVVAAAERRSGSDDSGDVALGQLRSVRGNVGIFV